MLPGAPNPVVVPKEEPVAPKVEPVGNEIFRAIFCLLTSVSKKPGQAIVLYHYYGLSRFFLKQTLSK